jgi:hypothetical protein
MFKHVERVEWRDVEKQIRAISPTLASALQAFATHKKRHSTASMLVARYQYGQNIIGGEDHAASHVISPCGSGREQCADCQELLSASLAGRPLGLVLSKSLETYLEFSEDTDLSSPPRIVPLRRMSAGDLFGSLEILQRIRLMASGADSTYFPMLRVSAGMRSVFVSLPLGGEDVGRMIRARLPKNILRSIKQPGDDARLARAFDKDNWLFLKTVGSAVAYEKPEDVWVSEVLFFPVNWLLERMLEGGRVADSSKDFALLLHEVASQYSNNLRTFHLQQSALSKLFRDLSAKAYVDRTVQHLLSIASGDFPGFAPIGNAPEGGPFVEIINYLLDCGLDAANGIEGSFPAILEPRAVRLQKHEHTSSDFAYYSLRSPTLPGPIEEIRSPRVFFEDLQLRLQRLDDDASGLFPSISWLFASSKPLDGVIGDLEIKVNSACEELCRDFQDQFELASTKWNVRSADEFFPATRAKFLSSFVRIRTKRHSVGRRQTLLT